MKPIYLSNNRLRLLLAVGAMAALLAMPLTRTAHGDGMPMRPCDANPVDV